MFIACKWFFMFFFFGRTTLCDHLSGVSWDRLRYIVPSSRCCYLRSLRSAPLPGGKGLGFSLRSAKKAFVRVVRLVFEKKSELEVRGQAEGVFDSELGQNQELRHVPDAAVLALEVLHRLDLLVGQEGVVNEIFE